MAYGDFKDLAKRTSADKFLRDKIFNMAKDPKYDIYQGEDWLLWFINFSIKRLLVVGCHILINLHLKMSN